MKSTFIIIVICFCIFSCKQKPDREELLAGKEYKYWVQVPKNEMDSMTNRISYFDREYKNLGYFYSTILKKFYMPEFDDVFYYPTWHFINDTIIDIGTGLCRIKVLTETEFIYDFRGTEFHYKVAPMEMIPKEYQSVQSIPKELQFN